MAGYRCDVCFKVKQEEYDPSVSLVGYEFVCPTCKAEYDEDVEKNSEF
jgi:hypothetical protein